MKVEKIEITTTTILKVFLLAILLVLVFRLRDIILLLFISFILMSAFNPWVDRLEQGKVPRWLAILFFYALFFGSLTILFASALPSFILQTQAFWQNFPILATHIAQDLRLTNFVAKEEIKSVIELLLQNFSGQMLWLPGGIFKLGAGIIGYFLNLISLLVVTFYLLLEHRKLKTTLTNFLQKNRQGKFVKEIEEVEAKLGSWLRGELFLMFVIGFFTYLGLTFLLRLPFALPLAIVAGFLEIVPILGPIISTIPALLVAAAFSPWKAISVILLYTLIQQLESNVLVPKVMNKAVGLDPLLVLLALVIGGRLAGPLGALLSVPILAALAILVKEFYPFVSDEKSG